MAKGTITRLIADRGYGYIQTKEGLDVFFHRNELVDVSYGSLREGQQVELEVIHTLKGLKAINVRPARQSR